MTHVSVSRAQFVIKTTFSHSSQTLVWSCGFVLQVSTSADKNKNTCIMSGGNKTLSTTCHLFPYLPITETQLTYHHYNDVIMSAIASQITGVSIVCWTLCSSANQRKHQSFVSLDFVTGIRRSPHKGQRRGALMFSLFCVWLSKQSRRRWFETPLRSHYDVIVMLSAISTNTEDDNRSGALIQ